MLKFYTEELRFEGTSQSSDGFTLSNPEKKNLLEGDIQKAIASSLSSWDLFKKEVGLPEALLIGEDITDDETRNRIDLLAYDDDDSSLVIIELKQGGEGHQLEQVLSYGAMVAKWDKGKIIKVINAQAYKYQEKEELIAQVKESKFINVKIILITEKYDPKVATIVDWLASRHFLRISAFEPKLYTLSDQTFINFNLRYPMGEPSKLSLSPEQEKMLSHLPQFLQNGVRICLRYANPHPKSLNFSGIRKNFDDCGSITLNFSKHTVHVGIASVFKDGHDHVKRHFTGNIGLQEYNEGMSTDGSYFDVNTPKRFEELLRWLKLA